MSISPAQRIFPDSSVPSALPAGRSSKSSAPAATAIEPAAEAPSPTPANTSPPQLSTDMRVDDQRRVYYEVVNDRTGDVV